MKRRGSTGVSIIRATTPRTTFLEENPRKRNISRRASNQARNTDQLQTINRLLFASYYLRRPRPRPSLGKVQSRYRRRVVVPLPDQQRRGRRLEGTSRKIPLKQQRRPIRETASHLQRGVKEGVGCVTDRNKSAGCQTKYRNQKNNYLDLQPCSF